MWNGGRKCKFHDTLEYAGWRRAKILGKGEVCGLDRWRKSEFQDTPGAFLMA